MLAVVERPESLQLSEGAGVDAIGWVEGPLARSTGCCRSGDDGGRRRDTDARGARLKGPQELRYQCSRLIGGCAKPTAAGEIIVLHSF